jgi:hypothetical protein
MEPGLVLGDIRIVIRRAVAVMLAAAGVVALCWDAFALLIDLSAGQNWDAPAVLTVVVMAVGGLAGLGMAWLVWPHRARLHGPERWLHRHDPPPSPLAPPLPNSSRPKFSE